MSDERFFKQIKDTLHDYQPAVDESVYAGMRRKLWWSNFTKLSFHRFNMYYLLVLMLGAGTAIVLCQNSAVAERANIHYHEVLNGAQILSTPLTVEQNIASEASSESQLAGCTVSAHSSSGKNSSKRPVNSSQSSIDSDLLNNQIPTAPENTSNIAVSGSNMEGQIANEIMEVAPDEQTDLTQKMEEVKDPHLGQKAWKVTVKRDGEKPKKKKEN